MVKIYGEGQILDQTTGEVIPSFSCSTINSIESFSLCDDFNLKTFQRVSENYYQAIRDNYTATEKLIKNNVNSCNGIIAEYSSETLVDTCGSCKIVRPFVAYHNGNVVVNQPNTFLAARQIEIKLGLDTKFGNDKVNITYNGCCYTACIKKGSCAAWCYCADTGYKLTNQIATTYGCTINACSILLEPTFPSGMSIKIDIDGNIVPGSAACACELNICSDSKISAFNEKIEIGKTCSYKATMGYNGTCLSFSLNGTGTCKYLFDNSMCVNGNVCATTAYTSGLATLGCVDAGVCIKATLGCFANVNNSGCIGTNCLFSTINVETGCVRATTRVCTATVCSTYICNSADICSAKVIATDSCFNFAYATILCSPTICGTNICSTDVRSSGVVYGAIGCFTGNSCINGTLNVVGISTLANLNVTTLTNFCNSTGNCLNATNLCSCNFLNKTGMTNCGVANFCNNIVSQCLITSACLEASTQICAPTICATTALYACCLIVGVCGIYINGPFVIDATNSEFAGSIATENITMSDGSCIKGTLANICCYTGTCINITDELNAGCIYTGSGNICSTGIIFGTRIYGVNGNITNFGATTGTILTVNATTVNAGTASMNRDLLTIPAINSSGNHTAAAFRVCSLRCLKENICPYTISALENLKCLNIVNFNYISDKDKERKVGIIADDSPEIFTGKAKNSFDINNTTAILVKAVQELNEKIEKMENK